MKTSLACVCLILCASVTAAAPLSAFQAVRQEVAALLGYAPFCRGTPCPDYEVVKKTSNYEIRKFQPTTWASVQEPGGYEKASSEGLAELLRYTTGANEEQEKLPTTVPLTVVFKANEDFTKAEQNHTVAYFIEGKDEDSAPKPTDANIKVFSTSEKTAYVRSFGGYATESSILSTAKDLADDMKADGVEANTLFFFALYDGPQRVLGRHNEVWLAAEQ